MSVSWNLKYGNPGTPSRPNPIWQIKNIISVDLPYPMRLAWDTSQTVHSCRTHRKAAKPLVAALTDVWNHARLQVKKQRGFNHSSADYDKWSLDWLKERGLDILGGTYAHRTVRGGNTLSAHAYGIAIDIDPEHNALGTVGRIAKKSPWVVDIFRRHGWTWGGSWRRKDPMHFELP